MKRNRFFPAYLGKTVMNLGLALIVIANVGCATAQQAKDQPNKNQSCLVGPDYYQSSDNPFHSD